MVMVLFPWSHVLASTTYEVYMKQLILLAKERNPDAPFAAMIINNKNNKILCTGVNHTSDNPMYHGEVDAINNCVKKFDNQVDWNQTTLITTAEPCPMCMGAIIWTGISNVVYGTSIDTLSTLGWRQINIPSGDMVSVQNVSKVSIKAHVLRDETDALFKPQDLKHSVPLIYE